jgi:hypothetical protein
VLLIALAASLASAAPAFANDFQTVYREYKRTGVIKPCRFSDTQLRTAERQTPPDVEQYAPSFLDALQAARERSSQCGKKPAAAPAPAPTTTTPTPSTPTPVPAQTATTPAATIPPPTAPTPAPTVPAQPSVSGVPSPAAGSAKKDDSAPVAVWVLAILGALAVLAALIAALAWWFGWSADRLTRPFRASCEDFAERLTDFRLEFTEWLRTGF